MTGHILERPIDLLLIIREGIKPIDFAHGGIILAHGGLIDRTLQNFPDIADIAFQSERRGEERVGNYVVPVLFLVFAQE